MGTPGGKDVIGASSGKGAFMRVGEVAELLGISERTVLRLCHEKQIKCFRVGAQWRIPRKQLYRHFDIDEDDL